MKWPQLAWLILEALGVGVAIAQHGKPREGNENCIPTIIGSVITALLLWKGGFFE